MMAQERPGGAVKYMSFLDAAFLVLSETDKPMTHNDMCKQLVDRQLIDSRGKTPLQTLNSSLNQNISRRGVASKFFKHAPGVYGLRVNEARDSPYVAGILADAKQRKEAGTLPFACDRDRSSSRKKKANSGGRKKRGRTKRRYSDSEESEEEEVPLPVTTPKRRVARKRVRRAPPRKDSFTSDSEESDIYDESEHIVYRNTRGKAKNAHPVPHRTPHRTPKQKWVSWAAVTPEAKIDLVADQKQLMGGQAEVDSLFGRNSIVKDCDLASIVTMENFSKLLLPEEQRSLMALLTLDDIQSPVQVLPTKDPLAMRLKLAPRKLPLRLSVGPKYLHSEDGQVRIVPDEPNEWLGIKKELFDRKELIQGEKEFQYLLRLGLFDLESQNDLRVRLEQLPEKWQREQMEQFWTEEAMGVDVHLILAHIRAVRAPSRGTPSLGLSGATLGTLADAAVQRKEDIEKEWVDRLQPMDGVASLKVAAATVVASHGFTSMSPQRSKGLGPEIVAAPKAVPSPKKGWALSNREMDFVPDGAKAEPFVLEERVLGWPAPEMIHGWTPTQQSAKLEMVGGRYTPTRQAAMEAALQDLQRGASKMSPTHWRSTSPGMHLNHATLCPICHRTGCDCQRVGSPSGLLTTPYARGAPISPVHTSGITPPSPWSVTGAFSSHAASAEGVRVRQMTQQTTPYQQRGNTPVDVTHFLANRMSPSGLK